MMVLEEHATTGMNLENMLSEMSGQILCDLTYMGHLEQTNAEAEGIIRVTRGRVKWRMESYCIRAIEFLFGMMKTFWK